jgi:hypothetical protein
LYFPDLRSFLKIIPVELALSFKLELVIKRLGIMIVAPAQKLAITGM